MGYGPIPVNEIVWYIKEYEGFIDKFFIDDFVFIIRSLDNEWLEWQNNEAERKRKLEESSSKNKRRK